MSKNKTMTVISKKDDQFYVEPGYYKMPFLVKLVVIGEAEHEIVAMVTIGFSKEPDDISHISRLHFNGLELLRYVRCPQVKPDDETQYMLVPLTKAEFETYRELDLWPVTEADDGL